VPASEHRPPNRGAGQLPHHRCEDRHRITVDEHIVFVDANGMPTGGDDALLVTRRAHTKKVWPGVWTNSFCGQPAAGEAMADALRRRAFDELRISALQQLQCVLPTYTYKTPAFSGVVEHEFCPVYTALTSDTPLAVPDEVAELTWMSWQRYVEAVTTGATPFSYWAKDQLPQLMRLGPVFWRAPERRRPLRQL